MESAKDSVVLLCDCFVTGNYLANHSDHTCLWPHSSLTTLVSDHTRLWPHSPLTTLVSDHTCLWPHMSPQHLIQYRFKYQNKSTSNGQDLIFLKLTQSAVLLRLSKLISELKQKTRGSVAKSGRLRVVMGCADRNIYQLFALHDLFHILFVKAEDPNCLHATCHQNHQQTNNDWTVIYIIMLTHKTFYARIGAGERQAYSFTPAHGKKYGELNTHTHRFILRPLDRSTLSCFCLSSFILHLLTQSTLSYL